MMSKASARWLLAIALCVAAAMAIGGSPAVSAGGTSTVSIAGTGSPQTGEFTPSGTNDVNDQELTVDGDQGPAAFQGSIVNRSFSSGPGKSASTAGGQKAKSNPTVDMSFEGLNHYQQRYSRGGNQFSVEPPDQGLCAGNGYVFEIVNSVLNVFSAATGDSVLPDNTATNIVGGFPRNVDHAVDINSFYGYPPAIDRTAGMFGPDVFDPSCLYDAQTQRFFVLSAVLGRVPTNGALTGKGELDLAVSQTADPTGLWNFYRIPDQNDGTDGTPDHGCPLNDDGSGHGPCFGDYPHIGADANGVYLTTNEYAFNPAFVYMGAQVYALSKAALAAGAASVPFVLFDTRHGGVGGHPGFTLWPAQSPGSQFSSSHGGTEYFLSSDAGDEAQCDSGVPCTPGTGTSTDLLVWSLTNTASLDSASPSLTLSNEVLTVGQYGIPPRQQQPGSGTPANPATPQGFCINDTTTVTIAGVGCWRLLFANQPPHDEVISRPDSNDTRMQQVMWANGKLWGALDTAINPDGGPQRAGIEWFVVNPNAGKLVQQGYLGESGHDFTYPAIGVTASGRGVMAFTDTGDATFPSAAYAPIDAITGVGSWSDIAVGAATDDGFTSYKSQVGNPPRTRWGDYGAASVDGKSVWVASEYIAGACDYPTWGGPFFGGSGDNLLGTCAGASHGPGPRTALANWSTRVSKLTP
jgi:hypothetical protein